MRRARGELLSAASAGALLIFMFGFAWYGAEGASAGSPSGRKRVFTEDGWHGLTHTRWVMVAAIAVALATAVLHVRRRARRRPPPSTTLALILGAVTSLLLIDRVLIDLPSPGQVSDQKLGALLGLFSALGIALGAWQATVERRGRRPDSRSASFTSGRTSRARRVPR